MSIQNLVPASVQSLSAGNLSDNGFSVLADLRSAAPLYLQVALGADTGFVSPVTTVLGALTQTQKSAGSYYRTHRFDVAGLQSATAYRYRIVDGAGALAGGTLTTAPAAGVAAAFSFAFGSCDTLVAGSATGSEAIQAIAADAPLFFMHIGDREYDNYIGTDIKAKRTAMLRHWSTVPNALVLNRVCPLVYMPDDHDSAGDDGHWDSSYSGTTFAAVMQRMRQVYRETTPYYPFLQVQRGEGDTSDPILTQVFTIANTRFIVLDTRSQRRYASGTPTMLGRNSGHELWDQYTAVVAAAQQAASDGIGLLFLVSPTNWTGTDYNGWGAHWTIEQTALLDALATISGLPRIIVLTGDSHQLSADDGTNTDKSTNGGMAIVQFLSSGLYLDGTTTTVLSGSGPYSWGGNSGQHTGNDRAYALVQVNAANDNAVVTFKGRSGAGSLSTVATYDTADIWD